MAQNSHPDFYFVHGPSSRNKNCALSTINYLLFIVLFLGSGSILSAKDSYEFTDRSGRKLEAIILSCNSTEVEVRRVADDRRFHILIEDLSETDQNYLSENYLEQTEGEKNSLVPGETLIMEFPELGTMADGKPAQCELSIPKNFEADKPVPFLVWFSGGKGSHKTSSARGLVDFDTFLVLALPYPNGRLPRLAVDDGEDAINEFWDFQRPMLEQVIELVPNISEEVKIAAGSSSGGHLVGSALDQKWKGFYDYFTGFILHEGGYSPEMKFSGVRSRHHILIAFGENSNTREWQEYFMEHFDRARGRADKIEIPKAGHGLNNEGRQLIREWIDETFEENLP